MAETLPTTATGVSPAFTITREEFLERLFQVVTPVKGDFVSPPILGPNGGWSEAMLIRNEWFPWIDEKLIIPKYDGVCEYLGIPSNRPTFIKDYHMIALNRAVDRILAPAYVGRIKVKVSHVGPMPTPTG